MTRVAILRYPGTWSERDFQHALSLVPGVESDILWHEDADLARLRRRGRSGRLHVRRLRARRARSRSSRRRRASCAASPTRASSCSARATASRSCARPGSYPARWCATAVSSSAATGCTCASRATTTPWTTGLRGAVLTDADRARRRLLGRRRPDALRCRVARPGRIPLHRRARRGDGGVESRTDRSPTSPASATRAATSSASCRTPKGARKPSWGEPMGIGCSPIWRPL